MAARGQIKKKKFTFINALQLVAIIVLLAYIQYAVDAGRISKIFIASPKMIVDEAIKIISKGILWPHLVLTLQELVVGYLLAAAVGVVVALTWILFPKREEFMDLFCSAIMAVPKTAILPLLILWFGIGEFSKELIIAKAVLVPVYLNTLRGMKEVSKSYKEARMALDVGKIFFADRNIIAYNTLGIGRLIYQLPLPLCKMFIKEIFDGKSPDDFDEETLTTINKFFENNLNVSETSRQLYIHRNTLVYRLDKLQKMTNLDLRVFEDAITFKIALMVVKYMKYMENLEY